MRIALLILLAVFDLKAYLARFDGAVEPEFLAAWRHAAVALKGEPVGVVCEDAASLTSLERSQLIAANWELAPRVATAVSPQALSPASPACLLSATALPSSSRERLAAAGYRARHRNTFVTIWSRTGAPPPSSAARPSPSSVARLRGALAIGVVLALLAVLTCRAAGLGRPAPATTAFALVVFLLASLAAASHGLLAPNGLGVQAGKAKLWYLCGGVPPGFFTDGGYAPYQPSYPPALALLALAVFALSGGCSDGVVQLLVPAALALILVVAVAHARAQLPVVLVLLLSPFSLKLASAFNAEPFAVLCLVAGLHRATVLKDARGWLVAGCAGLFRHEGLAVAVVFSWLLDGGSGVSAGRRMLTAAAPGLAWQAVVSWCGGGLQDFAFAAGPNAATCALAVKTLAVTAVRGFFDTGGLLLALASALTVTSAAAVAVLIVVGLLAVGCTTSARAPWLLAETLPRFLWLVALPAAVSRRSLYQTNFTISSR